MATLTTATEATIWEDGGATCMARIFAWTGIAAVQDTFDTDGSITRYIYNVTANTTIDSGTGLTIATVVFDTLQTDARWTADTTGYNFRDEIADTNFLTGNSHYLVEYMFNPDTGSGADFPVVFDLYAQGIRSS